MEIKKEITERGFDILEFKDLYNTKCSIQKSSLATEDAIWIGVDDVSPKIMASTVVTGGVGWLNYEIPNEVLLTSRMHLTQKQVKHLIPILQVFVDTGELPSSLE